MCFGECGEGHREICRYHVIARFLASILEPTSKLTGNFWLPPHIIHNLGISHALLINNKVFREVILCHLGICYWHVTEVLQMVSNRLPVSGDSVSLGQCSQHSEWLMYCYLQGSTIPIILRLGDQWRQRHHVHSEHRKPFNQWHSAASQITPSPLQHCCKNLRSCNIIVS